MTTTAVPTTSSAAFVPEGWVAGTWTIDAAHTCVRFAVRHLMSRVHGTFSDVRGQIVTSPDVAASTASAVIAVSSVSTGNPMRDDHLRSADFFDADRYPAITFTSRAAHPTEAGWAIAGLLTIRDVTRPVDLAVDFLGADPSGLQGEPRIGFSARTAISRGEFGISFGLATDGSKIVVGDKVDVVLDVQAFLDAGSQSPSEG